MIEIKSAREINALRESGKIVAQTFRKLEEVIQPGISLLDLDTIAKEFILSKDAETLYKGIRQRPHQKPFLGVITTSMNNEICHGIPDKRILNDGDIIGIDIGLRYKGWCGDACVTYLVGDVSAEVKRLVNTAKKCLSEGINAALVGNRIGAIGAAIQEYAESRGYSVVREYGGHGIGKNLWEEPFIPHIGPADRGLYLKAGMVINIEPMINIGGAETRLMKDEWTVVTADGSLSAQFEHMIAITNEGPQILSVL